MPDKKCEHCGNLVSKSVYYSQHYKGYCLKIIARNTKVICHEKTSASNVIINGNMEQATVTSGSNKKTSQDLTDRYNFIAEDGFSASEKGSDTEGDDNDSNDDENYVDLGGDDIQNGSGEEYNVEIDNNEVWEDETDPTDDFTEDKRSTHMFSDEIIVLTKALLVWQMNHFYFQCCIQFFAQNFKVYVKYT